MNTAPSWNDIYAAGTAAPVAPKTDTLSNMAFRALLQKSAAPIGSSKIPTYNGSTPNNKPEENPFEKFVHTPVIKQVLDALSVGTYSTANIADDALQGTEKLNNGDLSGLLDIAASPLSGIGKGVMAAAGIDQKNNVKTWSDVIKHGQDMAGVDSENEAAKAIQGIGGFIGDIALDPTTYLSVGASAAAKGAVKGFVEGGKGAARKAVQGAAKAAEGGSELVGDAARIAENADKAGLLNRFKEAGVQASGNYKDWMKENGGKIAKWQVPFTKSKNPADAAAIADTKLSDSVDSELENLIPKTTAANGRKLVPDSFTSPVADIAKPAEQVAEEATIAEGLKEAAKPGEAGPIIDDTVKLPETEKPKSAQEVAADIAHENMQSILKDVKFSKQTYSPEDLAIYKEAHEGSFPKVAERDVEIPVTEPPAKGKIKVDEMMARIQRAAGSEADANAKIGTIKFRGKQVHPRVIAQAWEKATTNQQKIAILEGIDKDFREGFREKIEVPKPATEKVIEEIPGTPIDYTQEGLSKFAPEHQGLTPEELASHRSPVNDLRGMQQYINNGATDVELASMAEKLGLPKSAPTGEISKAFAEQYRISRKRTAEEVAKAKADAKAAPKTPKAREAVGNPNQETAQLLEKVPFEQTLIRRANRAIQANESMGLPLTITGSTNKGTKLAPELVNMSDVEKLGERAYQHGIEVQSGKGRDYITHTGAKTETPDKNSGTYIFPDKWGTMSGIAIHGSLVKQIADINKGYVKAAEAVEGVAKRLPVYNKMELYRRGIHAAMSKLRAQGVAPYLDLGKGAKDTQHINLGYDDLADVLFTDMATRTFAGRAKQIQPQAFATGVEALIRAKAAGKTPEEVSDAIMKAFTGDSAIYRGQYKDAEGILRGTDKSRIIDNIKGTPEKPLGMEDAIKARMTANKLSYKDAKAAYLKDIKTTADKWANDDVLYQNLNNRMLVNAKEHGAELGQLVDRVSDETLGKLAQSAAKPISTGDFIAEMDKIVKDGKAALGEADETKYLLWENALDMKRVVQKGEQETIKTAESVVKSADKPEEIAKANTRNVPHATKDAEQAKAEMSAETPDASPETLDSLYDIHGGAVSIDTMRRIHPIASFFDTKFGLDSSGMFRAMGTGLHTQVRMQAIFHGGVMNYLAKNPDKLMEDWKLIQNEALLHVKGKGADAASFEPSTDSSKELYQMVNMIFDPSKDNIITRNGLGARHWNAVAESKGLGLKMDESKSMLENSRAWLEHEGLKDAESILEFLSKAHAVSVNLANDISIASNFARQFGSAVPKEGYARLNWSKRGSSRSKTAAAGEKEYGFFDLLPKSVYYSKEASRDIANIHRVLNEARNIKSDGPIGNFMNNVFNPITNIMKASQTIVRPGHWVNNTLGDVMRNYLAGVTSITPYRHSIAMMKANGKEMKALGENPLKAYEWHKDTATGNFIVSGKGAGVVIKIGGKPQKISYESLYRIMQDGPIMPKHHGGGVAEDFMAAADPEQMNRFGTALDKIQNKVLDNDHFSLNNLAAMRDNFSRTSLAIDHAMKGSFKDIHDLKASMEEQVLKWVPTSTDFTAKEAKYLRPAFMYYTWLRGITPRIVDTLMNKPGVALAPSKALYEAAKANGIDPVSFGNPFPPDAQMPSYYYDNVIGPLMHGEGQSLWGLNFANPVTDVMDQLGKGITVGGMTDGSNALSMGKTLLGSASPFAKIPIDMATGQSNGVPITDTNQYLQDALTGSYGGLLSKTTGKLWNGQGRTDTANGPAHGVDQSDVAILQAANFLSGLKITDYNSPAAQRSFMGEQKQKFSEQKADYRRNQ